MMDSLLPQILHNLSEQWIAALIPVFFALKKLGFFQWLGIMRATSDKARFDERQLLSQDQARLIEDLRKELTNLRRWRREDAESCQAQITQLRVECELEQHKLRDQIASLIKDAARWRHLVGNLAQHIAALRYKLQAAGIEVARFEGWTQFITDGGDPSLEINDF
jgi:hypothetical protein